MAGPLDSLAEWEACTKKAAKDISAPGLGTRQAGKATGQGKFSRKKHAVVAGVGGWGVKEREFSVGCVWFEI